VACGASPLKPAPHGPVEPLVRRCGAVSHLSRSKRSGDLVMNISGVTNGVGAASAPAPPRAIRGLYARSDRTVLQTTRDVNHHSIRLAPLTRSSGARVRTGRASR
jgi:hypothetical protein